MTRPSLDAWLDEARADPSAPQCGMYLFHDGVVRSTPRAKVRGGEQTDRAVQAVDVFCDRERVEAAIESAKALPGIYYVRVWLNEGRIPVGGDIMLVLVGGDIRPRVIDALQLLVGKIKSECVSEEEIFQDQCQ